MKKRIVIVLSSVLVLILIVIALLVFNKKAPNKNQNIQNINFTEQSISETTIDNGLLIVTPKIESNDQAYIISMIAKNQTEQDINMDNYRISFLDFNNNEVYWFRGAAIGMVKANSEVEFTLEVDKNSVHDVKKISYSKFSF